MEAGLTYSNPIIFGRFAMLHRSAEARSDLSFNTRILTERFPTNVLWLVSLSFLLSMLLYAALRSLHSGDVTLQALGGHVWEFVREMTPGANSNSFPLASSQRLSLAFVVKSAALLSMVYQMFYSALLAESLMVRPGVDLDRRPYDVLGRLTARQTVLFATHDAHYSQVMDGDHAFSRLIRAKSFGGAPSTGGTPSSLVNVRQRMFSGTTLTTFRDGEKIFLRRHDS